MAPSSPAARRLDPDLTQGLPLNPTQENPGATPHKTFVQQERFWLTISAFCILLAPVSFVLAQLPGGGSGLKSGAGEGIFAAVVIAAFVFGLVTPIMLYRRYKALQKAINAANDPRS